MAMQPVQPVAQPAPAVPAAPVAAPAAIALAAPAGPAPNAAFVASMVAVKARLLAYLTAPGNAVKVSVPYSYRTPSSTVATVSLLTKSTVATVSPLPYLPYPPYRIPLTVSTVSHFRSTAWPIAVCPRAGTVSPRRSASD